MAVEFRILGPLEVRVGGAVAAVSRPREQRVLVAMLLNADHVLPVERLVDAVFDDRPPDTSVKQVRNCVSALRQRLTGAGAPGDLITTTPAGYLIRTGPGQLDAAEFARRLSRGRRWADAGRLTDAVTETRAALALWRGPALAGITGRRLKAAAAGLDEQRLAALEQCVAYELALGEGAELVAELSGLVAEYPVRERLRGQLMTALYRAGRRADALDAYRGGRRVLVEELGLEPGPELRALEQAILVDDARLLGTQAPTGPVTPAQLPAEPAAFTGRTDHLRDLDALVADGGDRPTTVVISAIAGAAGVGKTALAVHWAHRVRSRFGDGQLYLDLRGFAPTPPMRPIEALALCLRALGVPAERTPVDLDEAAAMYRSLLADRCVLVVLDNAASPEQVRPLLPGGSRSMVLVTSRDRLTGLQARDGARALSLDVLTPTEAHALLTRILGTERVAAETAATEALARLCAYLPLALRIAAAALTSRPNRRIAAYVAELQDGDRVAALSVDGDEESAVKAAFDLSYAALSADERTVFRRLGLASGPDVTAGAVAALSDTTPSAAARVLNRLVTAHLVDEHAEGRFTFHDLLRQYAAERARQDDGAADRTAAVRRLHDWYLCRVEDAARCLYPEILRLPAAPAEPVGPSTFDSRSAALSWLDTERINLVAAITDAAERGSWSVAWRLSDGLRGYFHLGMSTVDWLSTARAGLAAAQRAGDLAAEAAARLSLGDLHWRTSRYPLAIEQYGRAAAAAERAGWPLGAAAVHGNLGIVCQQSGRLTEAVEHFQQALATATAIGWTAGEAANLENLGEAYWELGRLADSADQCVRALAVLRAAGSSFAQAVVLTGLGEVRHAQGRLDEALDHLARALTLHREVGNRGGEAETIRVLATVHRDTGRPVEALDLANAALAAARAAGDRRYEADALNTVAGVRRVLGDHRQAVDGHRSALQLAREIGNRYPEAEALIGLAAAARCLGSADLARRHAAAGLDLADRLGYRILEGDALAVLAALEGDRGDAGAAGRYADRARSVRRATGHRPLQAAVADRAYGARQPAPKVAAPPLA